MSDSSDICSDDEIRQIKNAMRVAKSRQVALKHKLGASHRLDEEAARCHGQRCRDQAEEIVQLRLKLVARDDEIGFLQARVAEKDKGLREAAQLSKLKHTAAIASLWDSLRALETRVNDRRLVIAEECDGLIRLVCGLEQHAMGGHHMVSSRTAIGLFIKMRESIAEIKAITGEDGDAAQKLTKLTESIDITKTRPSGGGSLKDVIADKTGRVPGPGGKRAGNHSADQAYLDLCRYLEEENGRLQRSVELAQAELERFRAEAEAAALIPQYRLAIVRARSQAGQLQDQLIQEQTANKWLRAQLDLAHKELQIKLVAEGSDKGREDSGKRSKRRYGVSSKRTSKLTSAHPCDGGYSFDSLHSESDYRQHTQSRATGHASSGSNTQQWIASSASELEALYGPSSSGQDMKSREREVEMDLQALDSEIALLKGRLEQAALSHTQRVVSQVMASTPGSILT